MTWPIFREFMLLTGKRTPETRVHDANGPTGQVCKGHMTYKHRDACPICNPKQNKSGEQK